MALIDKETIRAEIERRLDILVNCNTHFFKGRLSAYKDILAFLDSLPEQPVTNCNWLVSEIKKPVEGLEGEIDLWISENENIHHGDKLMVSLLKDVARYFYELGQQNRPKISDTSLEEEIERFYRTDEYRIADTLGRGFETLARHFAEWGAENLKR